MARALDAVARANVEVLLVSSSSYRQNFCFLVRQDELERSVEAIESALALEFAHQYLKPIAVDRDVGLLAAVGEGMQGKPGLAGRIFTAISRVQVNIIAIAQGSSELTIAVVVRRDGLEKAVKAVHAECGLGMRPPVPVFTFPMEAAERGNVEQVRSRDGSVRRIMKVPRLEHRSSSKMFDLFRSRDKAVRILLGALLVVVGLSMLTYLVPSYNTGGSSANDVVVAEVGKDAITLPEVQRVVQNAMRGRQIAARDPAHLCSADGRQHDQRARPGVRGGAAGLRSDGRADRRTPSARTCRTCSRTASSSARRRMPRCWRSRI